MTNPKFENLLNLSLDATDSEREKSMELMEGYSKKERSWELIVKTTGDLAPFFGRFPTISGKQLRFDYAILEVPESLLDMVAAAPEITYAEKPKRLFFSELQGSKASCISPLQTAAYHLTGKGVLIAILDSGIDYTHPDFRNPDGSSRILYLWDQSLGKTFDQTELNEALKAGNESGSFALVPSRDLSGHGTHVAGICAGNGSASKGEYRGVAYESSLLIVKLGTPKEDAFPRTTELMEALDFVMEKALELIMPLVINISFGNSYGSHSGSSLLETYINAMANDWKNSIIIGTGNEGSGKGHTAGILTNGETREIELAVGDYESSLNVQVWKSYSDDFDISIIHPNGKTIGPIQQILGPERLILESTKLLIYYGEPSPYSLYQEIYIDFLPERDYLDSGIWKLVLVPRRIAKGHYDLWLPGSAVLNASTGFLYPSPNITLTIPSTAEKAISVGAYDSRYGQLADFSGRGYTWQTKQVKPELSAPGTAITSCAPGGGYAIKSGTSMATPFVTGTAALLMQWGIVEGNDPFLYGEKLKAYLIRGAKPLSVMKEYPNPALGYGVLCARDSLPI
ncbi:hypothetical protein FACS1894111_07720 [Clostridia bacterium]|nr:hypothetical protein FACS1894111_07720 [Clostridia bacterium]